MIPIPIIMAGIKLIGDVAKKSVKSKTIDFNVIAAGIVAMLAQYGIDVPIEIVVVFFTVLNIFLRWITKTPMAEK